MNLELGKTSATRWLGSIFAQIAEKSDQISVGESYMLPSYKSALKVKNQAEDKETQECWANSFASAFEAYNIIHDTEEKGEVYSARHINLWANTNFSDGERTDGRFARNAVTAVGGNYDMASVYATNGYGPVLEEDMPSNTRVTAVPFNSLETAHGQRKELNGYIQFPPVYKLWDGDTLRYCNSFNYDRPYFKSNGDNIYEWFGNEVTDITTYRNLIKEQIIKNGAVGAYIAQYANDKDIYIPLKCNPTTGKFGKYNHAVLIIGWDDNYYPPENNGIDFDGDDRWRNPGAYIALNSYGKDRFYDGYVYISYDDFCVEQRLLGLTDVSKDKYDNVYYHDELGCRRSFAKNWDEVTTENIFTRTTLEREELTQIAITACENQTANIYYTESFDSNGFPINYKLLKENVNLQIGATPIDITGITLSKDKFAVAVTYKSSSSKITIPVELENDDDIYKYGVVNEGESYIIETSDDGKFDKNGQYSRYSKLSYKEQGQGEVQRYLFNAGIKAYTKEKTQITGSYNFKVQAIRKREDALDIIKLPGVKFDITKPDGSIVTKTTDEDGLIDLGSISITNIAEPDIYILKETKTLDGYKKLKDDEIKLKVTKSEKNGKYIVQKVDIEPQNAEEIIADIVDGTVIVEIQNEMIKGKYNLQILKQDKDDNTIKLKDAEFKISISDKEDVTLTTDENGQILIKDINITDIEKDIIKIKEMKAPNGYIPISEDIDIDVTKKIEDNEYKVKEAIIKQKDENIDIMINENTVIVTIKDKRFEGNYNIKIIKEDIDDESIKLSGAKFRVTVPDYDEMILTTGNNGEAITEDIYITKAGTDIIKIEEIKAPGNYEKMTDIVEIELEKVQDGEIYIASTAKLRKKYDNVDIAAHDNTITIVVKNNKTVYDLALKQYITEVRTSTGDKKNIGEKQERTTKIEDVSDLLSRKQEKADAIYSENKTGIQVEKGDYIIYKIRVFNEGLKEATAEEIENIIPEGLEFVGYMTNGNEYSIGSRTNYKYGWKLYDASGKETDDTSKARSVKTTYLSDTSIPAFDSSQLDTEYKGLSYADVQLELKVTTDEATQLKNIAQITKKDGEDSDEDSQDYEVVISGKFDLALRKFITQIDEKQIKDRIPEVDTTDLDTGKRTTAKYEHTKDEQIVVKGQILTYTIRVYNEGTINGYVEEIKDNLPDGITFLPEHKTNQKYGWKMYDKLDKETDDVTKATSIRTTYGAKANKTAKLLKGYNKEKMQVPDYIDVEVAFEVTLEEVTAANKTIINMAEIVNDIDEYGNDVYDIDSKPNDGDESEDDDFDKEYILLKYFDISLSEFISKILVTEDAVTKETDTNYNGTENPRPIVKVEINKKNISTTEVKYVYTIKVVNEGEIEGYVKEIKDTIPEGFVFSEEDNKEYNWKVVSERIVTTDYLKNKLLQPGESVTIQLVLKWNNSENNLGQKVNVAEISKYENQYGAPDIDAKIGNGEEGEDDQDSAIVLVSLNTGSKETFFVIGIVAVAIIGAGIYTIKKFVL